MAIRLRNQKSMVDPKQIDWNALSFSLIPTAYMYVTHCQTGETWQPGKLEPFGNISISPAACVLNYGQGLFEGLKAYYTEAGKVVLFRPKENAARMAEGCRRLCIPPIPEEIFMAGVTEVTKANKDYVPPYRQDSTAQGALYLRPVIWGSGPILGVAPAPEYTFLVFASPVGPYFKAGFQPIKLKISKGYHRAAPGGVGGVKAIGNYSCGMLPASLAKAEGYSEVLYLDAKENRYVEEVGAANFFCLQGDTLLTPELDGTILPGITRRSVIKLARERFGLKVEERKVKLEEVLEADEAFASGTAAVISPIGSIHYGEQDYTFNNGHVGAFTEKIYQALTAIQFVRDADPYDWVYPVC